MQNLRNEKLRRLIAHADANCSYWHDRLKQAGLRTRDFRTLDDLVRLPLMTRADIDAHRERMRWTSQTGKRLVYRTSGTTDDNLDYYWDRRRQAWDIAARLRAHGWFGLGPGSYETYVWPIEERVGVRGHLQHALRSVRDWCCNDQMVDAASVGRTGDGQAFIAALDARPPDCIFGYPSAPSRLCQGIRRDGRILSLPNLRCILVTGEPLYASQRRLIEDTLNVRVFGEYGVQEAGLLARQCPHGRWHETSESIIIEVLTHGRPTEPGQLGEVVVTQLESWAMPIIRYRTGDIAVAIADTPCTCGRTLRVVPEILGRQSDFLINASPAAMGSTSNGQASLVIPAAGSGGAGVEAGRLGSNARSVTAAQVGQQLDDLVAPESYCVRQNVEGHTSLAVLDSAGLDSENLRRASHRIRSLLVTDSTVRASIVPHWPIERSGKHRPVISAVPHPNLA